jgi:hypothetical protein
MRIIFFDIDGVTRLATNPDGTGAVMVHVLCQNLADLASATNAKLVVSSQRRIDHSIEELARDHGLSMEMMHGDQLDSVLKERGLAILRWLARHPDVESKDYIIIDDDVRNFQDHPWAMRRLVICGGRTGLVDSVVRRAREMLDGMSDEDLVVFKGGDSNDDDL